VLVITPKRSTPIARGFNVPSDLGEELHLRVKEESEEGLLKAIKTTWVGAIAEKILEVLKARYEILAIMLQGVSDEKAPVLKSRPVQTS